MSKKTVCLKCQKEIIFIKMPSGKFNPCDLPILIHSEEDNNPVVVSETGKVAKLDVVEKGYISHFSTCPHAKDFRKKG